MLVSLFHNFYEEFAEDIPFLNFAIILFKRPENIEPIQPSLDMSFLVCVQMVLDEDTFRQISIEVFKLLFIAVIRIMETMSKQIKYSQVVCLARSIFTRVFQIQKVFQKILYQLEEMPVAYRKALLTDERLFQNPNILQQLIRALMHYQCFEILFEYIQVYGLENYSILMAYIDFSVLLQSEHVVRFVLKTLFFKQKSEESQRKLSLFLKARHGCCMLLDMLNYSLSRFQKAEATNIVREFFKFEFLSEIKHLLVIASKNKFCRFFQAKLKGK